MGTYFDRDAVLRMSRVLAVLSWVVAAIYAADFGLGVVAFASQYLRGFMASLGATDMLQNILYIFERPLRGILYFAVLQSPSKGTLIALDVEDNRRRAAGG